MLGLPLRLMQVFSVLDAKCPRLHTSSKTAAITRSSKKKEKQTRALLLIMIATNLSNIGVAHGTVGVRSEYFLLCFVLLVAGGLVMRADFGRDARHRQHRVVDLLRLLLGVPRNNLVCVTLP